MRSSTSPSELPRLRLAPWLAATAVVSLLAAAAYTLWLNPEIRFYRHAAVTKRAWAEGLRTNHSAVTVVYGASSCAFALDGERLRDRHGLAVANFGLHAGMEPLFLTAFALESTRPGDTLVVALEPPLLRAPFESPDLAAQMGMALGAPRLIHASALTGQRVRWVDNLVSLRPGAYHLFTLAGKILLGRPLYRYAPRDVSPSGWQQTAERRPITPIDAVPATGLSPDARRLLTDLRRWADANHVTVFYAIPWGWTTADHADATRRANARFLRDIADHVPVLHDPTLGVHPVREHFADTEWHLTSEGAVLRTDAFARQLRERRCWTLQELDALAREP